MAWAGIILLQWFTAMAAAVAGLILSAAFSGLETGTYLLNKIRLDLRAETGQPRAQMVQNLFRRPQRLLVVLLLGNNLANYMVTYAVKAMFALGEVSARQAELYTIATTTAALFILGESLPKNVFQRGAEALTYRFAPLLRATKVFFTACGLVLLVEIFVRGLTRLLRRGAKDADVLGHRGVAAIVAEGHASGALSASQSRMAQRVMDLAHVTLAEAMVPMDKVVTAPPGADRPALVELLRGHEYRRVPLLGPDQTVEGILDIYDALSARDDRAPTHFAAAPLILPQESTVTDSLYRMQRARAPMAVVSDPAGAHVGIVTTKDLVEEIVGELADW